MFYKKYLVREDDRFEPDNFPSLTEDLDSIQIAMQASQGSFNSETLLSVVKNGRKNSVESNTDQTEMGSLESLPLENLKAMFESCSENQHFSRQLEDYIKTRCRV